jgi:hypothetical protein
MTEQTAPQPDKSRLQLSKLADDIIAGKVFGSWDIAGDSMDLGMIFFPLLFGAKLPPNVGHVYEYLHEADPRSINGYPIFFSCHVLTQNDMKALWVMVGAVAKVQWLRVMRIHNSTLPWRYRIPNWFRLLWTQLSRDPWKRVVINVPTVKPEEEVDGEADQS